MADRFLEVSPGAIRDSIEAQQWYAQRSPQAAVDFMAQVDRATEVILEAPNR